MKRNSIAAMKEEIAAWRRELHQNPGLAYEEHFASAFVEAKLVEWGVPFVKGLGKTGIVATIEGQKNTSGKRVGFRADMDALPLDEKSGQAWASKVPGVMHACGHDGHTATVLGFAIYLSQNRNFDGTVRLIFQPAEEGAGGAMSMITDGLFKGALDCDAVYGFHNWPSMPVGHAGIRPGPLLASVDEFNVVIQGKGGHAAYPHLCVDPIVIFAQMVQALQTVVSRACTPQEPLVLSITDVHAGKGAFNVIPDDLSFKGTVRSYNNDMRTLAEKRIREIAAQVAAANGASVTVDYKRNIDATINNPEKAMLCADAMARIIGDENVNRNVTPSMGGEDFGAMLAARPGAYIYVGQGTGDKKSAHDQALHNPQYDFNDEIIPIVMDYMAELVDLELPLKG